jgi:hypothetical protein
VAGREAEADRPLAGTRGELLVVVRAKRGVGEDHVRLGAALENSRDRVAFVVGARDVPIRMEGVAERVEGGAHVVGARARGHAEQLVVRELVEDPQPGEEVFVGHSGP